ncbi:hypothetical protein J6590_044341 [Homalodisca vitripennis]|nr:hypothetical protein J6590_044341 [Homalodisca vitripennis]
MSVSWCTSRSSGGQMTRSSGLRKRVAAPPANCPHSRNRSSLHMRQPPSAEPVPSSSKMWVKMVSTSHGPISVTPAQFELCCVSCYLQAGVICKLGLLTGVCLIAVLISADLDCSVQFVL